MKAMGAVWRLLRGLGHLLVGLWIIQTRFHRLSPAHQQAHVQIWSQQLLALWRIRIEVRGDPVTSGPALLVANHISWLDIVVMHAARYCRFVSKADVKDWPVVGALATGAGTLYVQRESRRDAMRVVRHMVDALRAGEVVAVFPEGTTSDGLHLLPFHANLIQAAISAPAPVQPVALRFLDARTGRTSLAPCYIGDDSLLRSVWRTLTTPEIVATVTYGTPQTADGRDRRSWAADLRASVDALRTDVAI